MIITKHYHYLAKHHSIKQCNNNSRNWNFFAIGFERFEKHLVLIVKNDILQIVDRFVRRRLFAIQHGIDSGRNVLKMFARRIERTVGTFAVDVRHIAQRKHVRLAFHLQFVITIDVVLLIQPFFWKKFSIWL